MLPAEMLFRWVAGGWGGLERFLAEATDDAKVQGVQRVGRNQKKPGARPEEGRRGVSRDEAAVLAGLMRGVPGAMGNSLECPPWER